MKHKYIRLSLLIVVLTLTSQPSLASAADLSGQSPAHATITARTISTSSAQRNRRCRARCNREYILCTRGIVPPGRARCRARLRNCLRRCER